MTAAQINPHNSICFPALFHKYVFLSRHFWIKQVWVWRLDSSSTRDTYMNADANQCFFNWMGVKRVQKISLFFSRWINLHLSSFLSFTDRNKDTCYKQTGTYEWSRNRYVSLRFDVIFWEVSCLISPRFNFACVFIFKPPETQLIAGAWHDGSDAASNLIHISQSSLMKCLSFVCALLNWRTHPLIYFFPPPLISSGIWSFICSGPEMLHVLNWTLWIWGYECVLLLCGSYDSLRLNLVSTDRQKDTTTVHVCQESGKKNIWTHHFSGADDGSRCEHSDFLLLSVESCAAPIKHVVVFVVIW